MNKGGEHREKHRLAFYRGRTLLNSFFARPRPIHLLMAALFLVFGLALVTQVRAQQTDPLESLSETELVELLAELDDRTDTLRTQQDDLTAQLDELNSEADQLASAEEAAAEQEMQAKMAAGLIPVKGPGIVLGVADPGGGLSARDFVTTLAELRNSGAEAIEVGGVRLTLRSWFADSTKGIVVDGEPLTSPYTWHVIGDSATLESGLRIRGGAASQMTAFGATVTIKANDNIVIKSVAPEFTPRWAKPTE